MGGGGVEPIAPKGISSITFVRQKLKKKEILANPTSINKTLTQKRKF